MNKTLLPKLRFPEYQDEWEEKELGDIGEFTGGGTPSKDNNNYWNGNIPWISSSDISEESIHEIAISRFITKEAVQESATKLVPANSILLVSRVGVGKLAVTYQPICTSQDFTNLTPTKDNLIFLGYYLKSRKKEFLAFNQGMAIQGFTKKDIESLQIFLPTIPEQQKIADCLTSLDDLIAVQNQKVEILQAYKKGLMQNLFPAEGESVPRLRFPEFESAGEWEEKKLEDVCERIMDGTHFSPKSKSGSRMYLTSKNIQNGIIDLSNVSYITEEEHRPIYDKTPVRINDVLLTKDGANTGNCAINNIDVEFSLLSSVAVLRGNPLLIDQRFLYQTILSDRTQNLIQDSMSGQAITRITLEKIAKFSIAVTTIAEQQRIAELLSALNEEITAQGEALAALKVHKRGLMQGLFP